MKNYNGLLIETITNGPFMENCYLVADEQTRQAIVIDPGDEELRIYEELKRLNFEVHEILNTHGHIDHVGGVAELKRLLCVPFAIHPQERPWLSQLSQTAQMYGLPPKESPTVDRDLAHGQSVAVGGLTATVLYTPGHSAGGCCFYFAEQRVVFVGDTLFAGSIGRTDLPGGSMDTLLKAIRQQLLALDDQVVVFCGHGPSTTIGTERRANPFLQEGQRFWG